MRILHTFILAIALIFIQDVSAQNAIVSKDEKGNKVIKGFTKLSELAADSAFNWIHNAGSYKPDANALKAFATYKDSIHILSFIGTWCDDSKSILPQFSLLAQQSGLADSAITIVGVDPDKKTLFQLEKTFNVTLVPTFIVLRNGKEIGRVVEYGKYFSPVKEMGEIINKSFEKPKPVVKTPVKKQPVKKK